jgi:hypothetical protein
MQKSRSPRFHPLRFSLPPERSPDERPPPEERHDRIAKAAYLRAERRNFAPGHELEDWLAAEEEVDREIRRRKDR